MKHISLNQKVKWAGTKGQVTQIKEEYSFLADDFRTIISIDWDDHATSKHVLTDFKRFGGQIEEID